MYDEIIKKLEEQLPLKELEEIKRHTLHLGIFVEPYLSYMLNGKKTVESRFSKNRIIPYHQITKEDIVFVKKSGGFIMAYFTIKEVQFFDLAEIPIEEIKAKYEKELCVSKSFWIRKKNSNYATLIRIDNIKRLKPFSITKRGMQSWIRLN